MGRKYLQRSELDVALVKAIEEKLEEEELLIQDITPQEFGISQRQFYYLKKGLNGNKSPGMSEAKIKQIAKKLGLRVEIRFLVELR